jgi:hypothetical protein
MKDNVVQITWDKMSRQILAQYLGDWVVYLRKAYLAISALQLSMSSAKCQVSKSPLTALNLRAEVTTTKVALVGVFNSGRGYGETDPARFSIS